MTTHRCMIVPLAQVATARGLAAALAAATSAGMWLTGASPSGKAPATHFISSGMIGEDFAALMTDPVALYAACQAAGSTMTQAQCAALLAACDVSQEPPFTALDRLGLQLVRNLSDA